MWLPKEQRKLLRSYYIRSGKTRKNFEVKIYEAMKSLGFNEKKTSEQTTNEAWEMVFNVNDILKDRGLINFEHEQGDLSNFKLSLTLKGLDLGRKYDSLLISSGLWFAEYKEHWFWLIISFFGGIIGALIVNWLSKGD